MALRFLMAVLRSLSCRVILPSTRLKNPNGVTRELPCKANIVNCSGGRQLIDS